MKPTKEIINATLLDVRKAFRLLHDYQRMALDAAGYISHQFGMQYGGGWPRLSGPPPRAGQGRFNNWSWDWLNMVFYEFHFYRELDDDWAAISILLLSDTGYFCADDEGLDRNNLAGYLTPEQSGTKIGVLMTRNKYPDDMRFLGDKAAMKRFIENDGELPPDIAATGMTAKVYGFECLMTEEKTNALIDDLIRVAQANKIKLERVAPKV